MEAKKYHYEVESFLEPIFQDFLNDRNEDIEETERALKDKDFDAISMLGHKLAGNAGSYGLPELGNLGKKLEEFGNSKNLKDAQSVHEQIKEFIVNLTVDFV